MVARPRKSFWSRVIVRRVLSGWKGSRSWEASRLGRAANWPKAVSYRRSSQDPNAPGSRAVVADIPQ